MREIDIQCPNCKSVLSAEVSVIGLEVQCPCCEQNFIATPGYDGGEAENKLSAAQKIKNIFKNIPWKIVAALVVIVIGVIAYFKITEVTPESMKGNQLHAMTQKRANRDGAYGVVAIAKHDFYPTAANKKDFIYRDAVFGELKLSKTLEDEVYLGEISFVRNGKACKRPIIIDRSKTFSHYIFPVDYNKNPEYLVEDGDLIFALATQIKKSLSEWSYVSAVADGGAVLKCTIAKGGIQKTLKLQVECIKGKDRIIRIWVKILPEK